jgi:predicted adenine nucleotide alpha hydrolase (AANH) superfamily ATPase
MKLLLHTCCGPCTIYPLRILREEGASVTGFFYRHNIHPYTECRKREETLRQYAEAVDLPMFYQKGYDIEGFLRNAVFRETVRCDFCYDSRLEATAVLAREKGFEAFSSTLLYSRYQRHDRIREIGESVGRRHGIPFVYRDFRAGWKEGVDTSRRVGMYRQPYCGCVYSEKERYFREP